MASVPARNHSTLIHGVTAVLAIGIGFAPIDVGVAVSGVLIALLGIPHGSMDLHLMSTKTLRLRELAIYILSIGLALGVWIWQPTLMLALFLVNSAWHFGDCDIRSSSRFKSLQALVYGISVLVVLIDLRDSTILWILQTLVGNSVDADIVPHYSIIRYISAALVVGISLLSTSEQPRYQLLQSVLVIAVAFLAPSLIAFTWYFVVVHSWTSMDSLRRYVDSNDPWTWQRLIIAAAPLTLLTLVGIGIGYILFPSIDLLAMLFIALSALTVPHSRLFHRVYVGEHR